ncbi:MAG: S66 peptidase family protein [Actinomycetota bacterium]
MTKGKTLKPGGTIGVPSPAWSYYNRSEILRGVEWWEQRGYKVKLADNIFSRRGYVAGSPEERADGIAAMFGDPEVDVVQCADAGFGSAHTLPHLDFDVIAANPKPFIGYSDTTALHTAIREKTGLVTFYGPLLTSLNHPETKKFTEDSMVKALTSSRPLAEVPRDPDGGYVRAITPGRATGELVGGCLWLLTHSLGTPWQVDLTDKIFFMEDVSSPPWFIDAQLTQMAQAGMLDRVAGVVVGEMEACDWREWHDWPQVLSIEDVLETFIEPLGVPAIYGLPMGHGKHLATTPLGVKVTLDADARKLTIDEPALED